jgi:hypothetical protein
MNGDDDNPGFNAPLFGKSYGELDFADDERDQEQLDQSTEFVPRETSSIVSFSGDFGTGGKSGISPMFETREQEEE